MYNPGYVAVSLDGFDFSTDTTGGGNNIYNRFIAALETGKAILLNDFIADETTSGTSSPAPATITRVDSGVLMVHTPFVLFTVNEDNELIVITTIPSASE